MRKLPVLLLLATVASVLVAARCYEPDTRVVVFIQGIYTNYQADGTQGTLTENHRFETMKQAFLDAGYEASDLLDFSYAGGTVTDDGAWEPDVYGCELTDRPSDAQLQVLEEMLREYRDAHEGVHFTLVGHSLGGYLAFLEGAREAARPDGEKLDVDVVVTVDAPLLGVSADKKTVMDLVPCDKTYEAGGELVRLKADASTPATRAQQASLMAEQGVRLATFGNAYDCLYNTAHCIGGDWADDSATQVLDGQASVAKMYRIEANALASHDAIVANPALIRDAVGFVGEP